MSRPSSFRWSPLTECRAAGLDDLMALHWEEIEDHRDVSPLAIDWPQYQALERQGVLRIWAAWAGDTLIGYNAFFVHKPLHHRGTLWAFNDGLWLAPDHRRGLTGVRLITGAEDALRELGVRVVWYSTKTPDLAGKRQRDIAGKLLARLGYTPFDASWSKAF